MTKIEFIKRYGEEAWNSKLKKDKEYKRIHRKQIREQNKQYREQHREQHKEERKEYMKQYKKQYREQHREQIRQYRRQYDRKHVNMFAFCIPEEWEQIENYQFAKKDNFNGWCIHHRLETHNSDGEKRLVNLSRAELKALDMYYNRPASELIFLTNSEHIKLHRK